MRRSLVAGVGHYVVIFRVRQTVYYTCIKLGRNVGWGLIMSAVLSLLHRLKCSFCGLLKTQGGPCVCHLFSPLSIIGLILELAALCLEP